MEQYILKSALVAEIEKLKENARMFYPDYADGRWDVCKELLSFIGTLEVKEINTWHLQEKEDIYDAVEDWGLHSFICLMDDGTVQKFTGIYSECYDGSINAHIDAVDDKYDTSNIIFWIETPL